MSFEKVDPNLDEGMGEGSEARVRSDNARGTKIVPGRREKIRSGNYRVISGGSA
jgi:hypothetical protein